MSKINRQSNFELIRVFAMIMIVMSHYIQHGFIQSEYIGNQTYIIISHFLGSFGQFGVTLFFLITGYFLIDKTPNFQSLIKIIIKTIFYSWSIVFVFLLFLPDTLNFDKIYQSILPISTGQYWFITTYVVLYLIIPILNTIFNNLSIKQIKGYLILFGILWFFIPALSYKIQFAFSKILGSIYIYMLGAYIKRYKIGFFEKFNNRLKIYVISIICILLWIYICYKFNLVDRKWWYHLMFMNSIFVLLPSISLFHFFKNINLQYNKIINYLSTSAFSVYLITENICMRKVLWSKIFLCSQHINIFYLLINILIATVISYLACVVIDKLCNFIILDNLFKYLFKNKYFISLNNNFNNSFSK